FDVETSRFHQWLVSTAMGLHERSIARKTERVCNQTGIRQSDGLFERSEQRSLLLFYGLAKREVHSGAESEKESVDGRLRPDPNRPRDRIRLLFRPRRLGAAKTTV